ncbi:hypothetical protein M407DRAFT_243863 [Tulasnella calospora MUT 4182]|uniref:Uncharacterized protein n=1 Tax=Tulasnella calospora MUT 4182 TaxID=1051891 RepID=A0A0C3QHI5_9AGAM|nr:hypothetical protein M407DRAFT_243863 [Tulasnella calospora MUT 4182]
MGEQTAPSGPRRSEGCLGLSRSNTKNRPVLLLDDSSDDSPSSATLSQRLQDFRYVPA